MLGRFLIYQNQAKVEAWKMKVFAGLTPCIVGEVGKAIINNLRRDSQINEAIVLERKDEPDNALLFTLYKNAKECV